MNHLSIICENCGENETAEDGHIYCSTCLALFRQEDEVDPTAYADAMAEIYAL